MSTTTAPAVDNTLGSQLPPAAPTAAVKNVRPGLPRSEEGIWAKAAVARDEIYTSMQRVCEQEGFDAQVVKSNAGAQPAWVRIDSWLPSMEPNLTTRAAAIVTIHAKEFRRFELEFTVSLFSQDTPKVFDRLRNVDTSQAASIARFVIGRGPELDLKSLELRKSPIEFWKVDNPVKVTSRDWLTFAPAALMYLAIASFVGALRQPFGFVFVLAFIAGSIASARYLKRRKMQVLSSPRPLTEPRVLSLVDSWQTVVHGLGANAPMLREALLRRVNESPLTGVRAEVECPWLWGLDGIVEREQIAITFGRSLLFCQLYGYDDELYVGWTAHLNSGKWMEKQAATGLHLTTGEPVRVMELVAGTQFLSEYDRNDANTLIEWTHALLTSMIQRLMEERKIDQEVDFKIIRGARDSFATGAGSGGVGGDAGGDQKQGGGLGQLIRRLT